MLRTQELGVSIGKGCFFGATMVSKDYNFGGLQLWVERWRLRVALNRTSQFLATGSGCCKLKVWIFWWVLGLGAVRGGHLILDEYPRSRQAFNPYITLVAISLFSRFPI